MNGGPSGPPFTVVGMAQLALGLASLGRPAYINLGREDALPAVRDVESMRAQCHLVLDTAYELGIRWVDAARSYGLSEDFLASWLRVASDPVEREKRYAAGSGSRAATASLGQTGGDDR